MNSSGDIVEASEAGPDGVPIDEKWVGTLRNLNRRGRLAYYAEKRKGASDVEAVCAAERAHCGGPR